MAFAHGAANAPSLGDWFSPGLSSGLSPRADPGPYPILNARNSSTTGNNTVNMFMDSIDDRFEYAASVVTACVDHTIYAIQCTAGPAVGGTTICGPNVPVSFNSLPTSMSPNRS